MPEEGCEIAGVYVVAGVCNIERRMGWASASVVADDMRRRFDFASVTGEGLEYSQVLSAVLIWKN